MIYPASDRTVNNIVVSDKKPPAQQNSIGVKIDYLSHFPVELIQKIAENLTITDYRHFRKASKHIAECLVSIKNKIDQQKQKSLSATPLTQLPVTQREITLLNKINLYPGFDIPLALKHIYVVKPGKSNANLLVGTKYLPAADRNPAVDRIVNAINSCRVAMPGSIVSGRDRSFGISFYPKELFESEIAFKEQLINCAAMKTIFAAFNHNFINTAGMERFVIATLANALKNYWCTNPPNEILSASIEAMAADFPALFITGQTVQSLVDQNFI